MLNRFSELINSGIASPNYAVKTFNDGLTSKNDGLCRLYNNVWGALTDTCMTKHDNEYVITGSLLRQPEVFEQFVGSEIWGTSTFKPATGFASFQELLLSYGLEGRISKQNNDNVYIITKK